MIPAGRPSGPLRAMYAGTCALCPDPIQPGDTIVKRRYEYAHYACATEDNE